MTNDAVSIAAIGLAGTTIAGLIWVVKYFAKTLSKDLQEHTKAAIQQRQASLQSAQASERLSKMIEVVDKNSQEQLLFMKSLNGKLAKATIQTVKEQNVEHQTVHHQD